MIDFDKMRSVIVKGLKAYLDIDIIRSNQTGKPPAYPYLSYTIVNPKSQNNGTYAVHDDGIDRKEITQTWSFTVQSDNYSECVRLACMAHDWFEHVGTVYLNDNDVIVQTVRGINPRDNILTIEYEHRNGFDVVFWMHDEIESPTDAGWIEKVEFDNSTIEYDDPAERLEARLDGDL